MLFHRSVFKLIRVRKTTVCASENCKYSLKKPDVITFNKFYQILVHSFLPLFILDVINAKYSLKKQQKNKTNTKIYIKCC